MDPSSEVSKKLRIAITAKLEELGAYVDDELADYILVMIANKKTKQQMIEDLTLFLNKHAVVFTNWLCGIVDRLHNIKIGPPSKSDERKGSRDSKRTERRGQRTPEKDKRRKDRERNRSERDNRTPEKEKEEQSVSPENDIEDKNDDFVLKLSDEEDKTDDEISLHADIVGDELDQERPVSVTKEKERSKPRRIRIEPPSSSPPRSRNVGRVRPMRRTLPSPSSERIKPQTYRTLRSPESQAWPEACQLLCQFHGANAMWKWLWLGTHQINNKDRQPLVQLYRAIMYAIDDESAWAAYNEISRRPYYRKSFDLSERKSRYPSRLVEYDPDRVSQRRYTVPMAKAQPRMFSRDRRERRNVFVSHQVVTNGPDVMKRKQVSSSSSESSDDSVIRKLKKKCRRSDSPDKKKFSMEVNRKIEIETENVLVVDDSESSKTKKGPRFVVTMEGVNDRKEVHKGDDDEMPQEPTPTDQVKTKFVSKSHRRLASTVTVVKSQKPIMDPRPTTESEGITVNPLNIRLDDEDYSTLSSSNTSGNVSTVKGKIRERCRFWPNCKIGEKCKYIHPTALCKKFPQCTFGDKCLFIHSKCKFDNNCTRPQCPYIHTKQVESEIDDKPKSYDLSSVPCKFGAKCNNKSCQFKHSELCKFGSNCASAQCQFIHDSPKMSSDRSTIDVTKYKWTAKNAQMISSS